MFNNKNLILGIVVIILFVIAGILVFGGNKDNLEVQEVLNQDTQQELGSQSLTMQERLEMKSSDARSNQEPGFHIQNLNSEGCAEIENDFDRQQCINAIILTKKAIQENDVNLCHDVSLFVTADLKIQCIQMVLGENK